MDLPTRTPRRSWFLVTTTTTGAVASALTVVTILGTWLLFTDAVVAAEVAADRSLLPLARAIVTTMGKALMAVIRFL